MSEFGLGPATPEFVKAFGLVAVPIIAWVILMVWFIFRRSER